MKNSLLPIILGAFSLETEPLQQALRGRANIAIRECGVGSVTAAAFTAALLSEFLLTSNQPLVIFVGSVGCADKSINIGSVVVGNGVKFSDIGLAGGQSYLPAIANDFLPADEKLVAVAKVEIAAQSIFSPIYSTPSITSDESSGQKLWTQTKSPFENLELFGVATACALAQVPWISISTVTNHLGPTAHAQWKAENARAAQKTAEQTLAFLRGLQH